MGDLPFLNRNWRGGMNWGWGEEGLGMGREEGKESAARM